jgi:type VI secretion system secreted protein VgrG
MPTMQPDALLERITGATLSGANRPIRLRLASEQGVDEAKLIIKHVDGVETMCGGIEYRLLCVSTNAGLPLKQFTAIPAELQFVTDSGGLRSVCGIVAQAVAGESDGGLATYLLVVRDALAIMEKRVNTRVFRNASEIDITRIILREWQRDNAVLARAFDFALEQVRSTPERESTMQYNESVQSGNFKGIFRQTGYEHQGSYKNESALHSTLYSLVRIAQTMEWTK